MGSLDRLGAEVGKRIEMSDHSAGVQSQVPLHANATDGVYVEGGNRV